MTLGRMPLAVLALVVGNGAAAGTFMFAEGSANPDLITHPIGYTGSGGTLSISVCIAPGSESKSELAIPVQNAIAAWDAFQPDNANVTRFDAELSLNQYDVESVLLHEVGHCIGLAHPNIGQKPGVSTDDRDFAMTLQGGNGSYDFGIGADGVRGSRDDQRGDDVNLNWFRIGSNDPFLYPSEIDPDTYSNDLADLPGSHDFVEIASYDVSQLRGEGSGEGVMNQGTFNQETQRRIHSEDATTFRIGMAGADENQGTSDDYDIELVYGGVASGCDITVEMQGAGFGSCSVSGTSAGLPSNHFRITTGTITLGSTANFNWYFNDTLGGGVIFEDRFEQ